MTGDIVPNTAINALTAPDAYSAASTIDPGLRIDHFNIDVSNQPIYWQYKQTTFPAATPGMATWGAEVYMIPGSRSIFRGGLAGVRFRAAIPKASLPVGATQAIVTVEAEIG